MSDFLERAAEEDAKEGPPKTVMEQVMEIVNGWERLLSAIDAKTEELSKLKDQEKQLSEKTIPDLLKTHGITTLTLDNGKKLSVSEKVFVRIPEDPAKREEAFAFLYAQGAAELIKESLTTLVPSQGLIDYLEANGIPYDERREANTNSLTAWFKDVLGMKKGSVQRLAPTDVPKVFGLYTFSKADLK